MGCDQPGGELVLIRRDGDRWRADVFVRRARGGIRLAAQVRGSLACAHLVAREGARLLSLVGGAELFVDFLSKNRCRVIGLASARPSPFAANQPPDADLESLRDAHKFNG